VVILSKPGNQRIAICFSGQLRTWKNCVETWKNIIPDSADIFCHFWDYNTSPNWINDGKNPQFIDSKEISEFLDIMKPKKYLIENYRPVQPIDPKQIITYHGYLSQFYGILRAARLKKQYEIENDIQYDVVVRSRYDNFYVSTPKDSFTFVRPNTFHGFHFGWDADERIGRIGDMFWFADSETYDIISDFYLNICTINPKLIKYQDNQPPEMVFFHYIKKCNLNIQINYWDIKVFRKSEDESFSKNRAGYEIW
jgi:hypothetical protein